MSELIKMINRCMRFSVTICQMVSVKSNSTAYNFWAKTIFFSYKIDLIMGVLFYCFYLNWNTITKFSPINLVFLQNSKWKSILLHTFSMTASSLFLFFDLQDGYIYILFLAFIFSTKTESFLLCSLLMVDLKMCPVSLELQSN